MTTVMTMVIQIPTVGTEGYLNLGGYGGIFSSPNVR